MIDIQKLYLRPQLLLLPLSLDLPSLTSLADKRIPVSPRRLRITDIRLLHLVRLDNDHPKILPGDWIVEIGDFLPELVVRIWLFLHNGTWWRVLPRA